MDRRTFLAFGLIFLILVGLVMVYSASSVSDYVTLNDSAHHLKRQVMGREVVVAVTGGHLDLGPWEQIFYGEFDGRRKKRVLVKIIGD